MIETAKMRHLAAKLRQMWGNNPDSILIEEAAAFIDGLDTPAEAEAQSKETPKTAPKRATKEK
jgi:hypothetical protein